MLMTSTEPNIFFQENQTLNPSNVINLVEASQFLSYPIPYLKKGDSNKYLEQFLCNQQEQLFTEQIKDQAKKQENTAGSHQDQSQRQSDSQKINPSAFHNFQKHLTVSLKHSIKIQVSENSEKDFQIAAAKMWRIFKNSSISTKKMLHYFLGQNNEHKIAKEGLKEYGLVKINDIYGQAIMKQARLFLTELTLKQIKQGKLEDYIVAKKLKNKDKFRKYVQIFTEELQSGFLRKRLPKDKVEFLVGC